MNKRQMKKELKKQLMMLKPPKETYSSLSGDIMRLVVEINNKHNLCLFLRFSGHVDNLALRISENKKRYNHEIASNELYTNVNSWRTEEQNLDDLKRVKNNLEYILETGQLPNGLKREYREESIAIL